jgi:hypothetical protein
MEFIVIGLVVLAGLYIAFRPKKVEVEVAPYKIEATPEVTEVADVATQAMVESVAPAKKPRAKKATAAKKPTVKKATTRKPKAS